ncbi:MAG: hypothetical protein LBT97_04800 [Planctomycetota bacterium]|nr:hypothetical protein [Planctomycetota bacterium]
MKKEAGYEHLQAQWTFKENKEIKRSFANWTFKTPNAQFVKITILAAPAFLIFAKWRLAV